MNSIDGHRVVDTCSNASDAAMSFQGIESILFGLREEIIFEGLVRKFECGVHQGAVAWAGMSQVHSGVAIDCCVEQACFLEIVLMHGLQATDGIFEPLCDESEGVDGEGRWGIPHGVFGGVVSVVQVARKLVLSAFEEIFSDNHDGYACGSSILLSAGINQSVLSDIEWTVEEVRGAIGDERAVDIPVVLELDALDCFVIG